MDTAPPSHGALVLASPDLRLVGETIPIDAPLVLGREPAGSKAVAVRDDGMSGQHARVSRDGERFLIEDLSSRNGIFVNGQRVTRAAAKIGAILRMGDTLLELIAIEPRPPIAPLTHGAVITQTPELLRLLAKLDKLATSDIPILLLGETGTGKEVLAQRLHQGSGVQGDFVAVNCGALPENLVEAHLFGHVKGAFTGATQNAVGHFARAQDGTLFLDEAGDLPLLAQVKLMRVLENKEFTPVGGDRVQKTNARIISATNASPDRFRPDLYARLAGFVLRLPPLRKRKRDIPLLAAAFLRELSPGHTFSMSTGFLEGLLVRDWPMNVRELKLILRRVAVLAHGEPILQPQLLDEVFDPEEQEEMEAREEAPDSSAPSREQLTELLIAHEGNVVHVAQTLEKNNRQIYRWLKKHGIDPNAYRPKSE